MDNKKSFGEALPWIVFTSFIFLLTYQARAMFGPLLPFIEAEFSINHAQATRLQLYISLGYSISMFTTVYTATIVRQKLLASFSVMATGVMLILVAFAPGMYTLIALCMLLGVASGQYFTGGLGVIRSLVSPFNFSRAVSIHELGPNLSFVLSPLVAVAGERYFGWRGVLGCVGVVALIAGAVYLLTGKGGTEKSPPFFFKGVRRAVKKPLLWLFVWIMGMSIAGQFGPYSVLTLHLTEECGLSEGLTSALLSSSRLLSPVAVLGGGFLAQRAGTRNALVFCLSAHALGLFMLSMPWLPVKIAGMFLQPMMAALTIPPAFTLLVELFPMRKQAMLIAIGMPLASFAGTGLMPAILGLCGTYATFSAGFVTMGFLVVLLLPFILRLPRRRALEEASGE